MYFPKREFYVSTSYIKREKYYTVSSVLEKKIKFFKYGDKAKKVNHQIIYQDYNGWSISNEDIQVSISGIYSGFVLTKEDVSFGIVQKIDFSKIVIEKGIIKTPFIIITNGERLRIVFEHEEMYMTYLRMLVLEEEGISQFKKIEGIEENSILITKELQNNLCVEVYKNLPGFTMSFVEQSPITRAIEIKKGEIKTFPVMKNISISKGQETISITPVNYFNEYNNFEKNILSKKIYAEKKKNIDSNDLDKVNKILFFEYTRYISSKNSTSFAFEKEEERDNFIKQIMSGFEDKEYEALVFRKKQYKFEVKE